MLQQSGSKNRAARRCNARRRKGAVAVYVALAMPVLLGIAAFAVDLNYLYMRQAKAQKAADAAALAGAYCLKTGGCVADTQANSYAALNGYSSTDPSVTIAKTTNNNQYTVVIGKTEPRFFANVFGFGSSRVSAKAIAEYQIGSTPIHTPELGGQYGIANGSLYTYEYFGPYGLYSNGDFTATKYLDSTQGANAGKANPDYRPGGVNFLMNVPDAATYAANSQNGGSTQVVVQIYDPATTDNSPIDDVVGRGLGPTDSGYNGDMHTQTQFTLIYDKDGNASNPDPSDHVTLGTQSYGNDNQYASNWVTPTGFTFDRSTYNATGSGFHVNVQTTNGATGNGFLFRAGPPHDSGLDNGSNDTTWNAKYGNNGTSFSTDDILPLNFWATTTANIQLGTIAKPTNLSSSATNAGTITINKFDTDIGANAISYYLTDASGNTIATYDTNYTFQGSTIQLNGGNGVFSDDTIVLPTNFPGGTLWAKYAAGKADNSQWTMTYSGYNTGGSPGVIRLVG